MKNNAYIQAIKRQKFARFAAQFAKFAAAFGLAAVLACGAYTMGQNRGYSAGLVAGAMELNDCIDRGGNGYFTDGDGFHCLYE
jgi:hypothetical protein